MGRCPEAAPMAWRLCGLLSLILAGCMPLGYAYPKVSYIPPMAVGAPANEVHAYRVDICNDDNCLEIAENDRYVLSPLPLRRDGSLDAQRKVAVDYGCILYCIAHYYNAATHHNLLVRLYRPGYRTIEIESWTKDGRLNWVEAVEPEAQEQAIDDLTSTWKTAPEHIQVKAAYSGFTPPVDPVVFQYLAPGSTSEAHRQTLLYAAGEYERLLGSAADAELRARLLAKAKALREMAAK